MEGINNREDDDAATTMPDDEAYRQQAVDDAMALIKRWSEGEGALSPEEKMRAQRALDGAFGG